MIFKLNHVSQPCYVPLAGTGGTWEGSGRGVAARTLLEERVDKRRARGWSGNDAMLLAMSRCLLG